MKKPTPVPPDYSATRLASKKRREPGHQTRLKPRIRYIFAHALHLLLECLLHRSRELLEPPERITIVGLSLGCA
jgi:hypothetical protein